MTTYARIADGIVAEVIEVASGGIPIEEQFHPDLVAQMVEAPHGVQPGWLWDGAAFSESDPEPPTREAYQRAIEAHVDAAARSRDYSGAISCASYVASTVPPWRAEAEAFVAWRDAVYLAAFAELDAVESGGDAPSIEDFLAALPAIDWPTA